MKNSNNVLIIDDHPIIIEGFKNTLSFIAEQNKTLSFKIDSATDCKTGYQKIQSYNKLKPLHLVILDLSLPPDPTHNLYSGDDLGIYISQHFPDTKILVITSYSNSIRITQTINTFNPLGFLNKQDLSFIDYVKAINDMLAGQINYSQTILTAIRKKSLNNIQLDKYDVLILRELANGAKMKDLLNLVHLSKSAIDKRKRFLKRKFQIESNSDRDLVLTAKEKGFI